MMLTVGQLARQTGVGVETIRFYQRQGLLEQPTKGHSGYRRYDDQTVMRLRSIKRAKELGFTLREIKELFSLSAIDDATCGEVKKQAEAKILDIQSRIRTFQRMNKSLTKLVAACSGHCVISQCPIIEALGHTEE